MLDDFLRPGRASFLVGGAFGSEAKGAAAAWLAATLAKEDKFFDIATCNFGAQSGHTSIHDGVKRVVFHLPTAPLVAGRGTIYLNAGALIDPDVLVRELDEHYQTATLRGREHNFHIHPNAAVITDDCRAAEMHPDSVQTRIASTRKGVGEALARKVLRSGQVARDHPFLKQFVRRMDLNAHMRDGESVLVEVPQGIGLSLNGPFYPHCTSRDCTVGQAMSDAGIHPEFYGTSMLVLRTYPIRVGHIERKALEHEVGHMMGIDVREGSSGGCYPDQGETSWDDLGVKPEITTVTKRVRRVFTFSRQQLVHAMGLTRPSVVFLAFCDYGPPDYVDRVVDYIRVAARSLDLPGLTLAKAYGPTTDDVREVVEWKFREGA